MPRTLPAEIAIYFHGNGLHGRKNDTHDTVSDARMILCNRFHFLVKRGQLWNPFQALPWTFGLVYKYLVTP